jgi:hypothetical protein
MARYIVAGVLGLLYVVGSVWIVHNEGESFRSSLRPAETATGAAAKLETKAPGTIVTSTPADVEPASAASKPVKAAQPVLADSREGTPVEPSSRHEAAPHKKRPAKNQSTSSSPVAHTRTESTPRPVATAKTTAAKDPEAAEMAAKVKAFWDQPFLKKSWDIAEVMKDAQAEINLGRELHDVIVQLNPTLEDSLLRRVEETAEPLLKKISRKDIRYTFTILDSETVNVFSTPGGFVYVSRGVFNMVGEDEEYALEFVLGHEIAHVDFKHALKCLQDSGVKKMPWGTLQKLYGLIIPAAFLDEQEYEADAWVFRQMRSLGRTNRECLAFLNKLEGYAKIHGFENGRAKPSSNSSMIDNHLPAHTAAYKRLKRLREIRDRASEPSK